MVIQLDQLLIECLDDVRDLLSHLRAGALLQWKFMVGDGERGLMLM